MSSPTNARKILIADDDPQMQLAIKATLTRAGFDVTVVGNGRAALEAVETNNSAYELIISDQRMPEMTGNELLAGLQAKGSTIPFIMITAHGTVNQAVEAMQAGATDFITKPFSHQDLERVVERVLSLDQKEIKAKQKKAKGRPIITTDPTMIRILEVAEAVAKSDATVLIAGESGTGKELIARLIHTSSPRSNQTFVAVNCAALPDSLLESELFGHEKGSFTGAQNKKIGKFELAHGGTILLDEISEMDLGLQAKLLRVLQEREVDRVGGSNPISIDVRVVATTNRNLETEVQAGRFRADLYYRLNVIPLTLPALRHRKDDIKLLSQHFIKQYLGNDLEIPSHVMTALQEYSWPGNIRELQNAIERGAILCGGKTPQESHFLLGTQGQTTLSDQIEVIRQPDAIAATADDEEASAIFVAPISNPHTSNGSDNNDGMQAQNLGSNTGTGGMAISARFDESLLIKSGRTVHDVEKALIIETLKDCSQNRTQASKLLGISIRTLRNKLAEYRLGE